MINNTKELNSEVLFELVNTFVVDNLKGFFKLTIKDDGTLFVLYPPDEFDGLLISIEEHPHPRDRCREHWGEDSSSYIQIEHGHQSKFLWWIDRRLHQFLARELEGEIVDDAHSRVEVPEKTDLHPTFRSCLPPLNTYSYKMALEYLATYPELLEAFWTP